MPVFRLSDALVFPDPRLADDGGLLAIGGDLRPERLLLAYRSGIFPWYSEGRPIQWWCPSPRYVLLPERLHVGRSLRKSIRRAPYRISCDEAFAQVIERCAESPRPGQGGTWITQDMRAAYLELHRRGVTHSVEAWHGDRLVGGLYGVAIGRAYFGESMFADAPEASKIAFVLLVEQLQRWGFALVDCQVHTEHLERFGAEMMELDEFLARVRDAVAAPDAPAPWRFEQLEPQL
ncbi:MAG: leucyl/phenylalanyl-tRNA--protein transferase [Deltaproteobacteria bacterium]|nr:leucyl/phenylalanyl-tRNA--protein transferase [Nannocystaceae bacterium]